MKKLLSLCLGLLAFATQAQIPVPKTTVFTRSWLANSPDAGTARTNLGIIGTNMYITNIFNVTNTYGNTYTNQMVNVKDGYAAVGNGSTDDSTAFQNALSSGQPVYVPGGTNVYVIATSLYLSNKSALIGFGSKISWTGSGACLTVGTNTHFTTIAGLEITGASSSAIQTGTAQHGIVANAYGTNSFVKDCTVHNVNGYAFEVRGFSDNNLSHQFPKLMIYDCDAYYANTGFRFDPYVGSPPAMSEYVQTHALSARFCSFGAEVWSGNTSLRDSLFTDCTVGVHIGCSPGGNPGHSHMVGCTLNHNTDSLWIDNQLYGFNVIGCELLVSPIRITNSANVVIQGSRMSTGPIYFDKSNYGGFSAYGGTNFIRDCSYYNSAPTVVRANGDQSVIYNVYGTDGSFLENYGLFSIAPTNHAYGGFGVDGNVEFGGLVRMPGVVNSGKALPFFSGSTLQVLANQAGALTNDGAGNLSWVSIAGGGGISTNAIANNGGFGTNVYMTNVTMTGYIIIQGTNPITYLDSLYLTNWLSLGSTETNRSLTGPGLVAADSAGGRSIVTAGSGLALSSSSLSLAASAIQSNMMSVTAGSGITVAYSTNSAGVNAQVTATAAGSGAYNIDYVGAWTNITSETPVVTNTLHTLTSSNTISMRTYVQVDGPTNVAFYHFDTVWRGTGFYYSNNLAYVTSSASGITARWANNGQNQLHLLVKGPANEAIVVSAKAYEIWSTNGIANTPAASYTFFENFESPNSDTTGNGFTNTVIVSSGSLNSTNKVSPMELTQDLILQNGANIKFANVVTTNAEVDLCFVFKTPALPTGGSLNIFQLQGSTGAAQLYVYYRTSGALQAIATGSGGVITTGTQTTLNTKTWVWVHYNSTANTGDIEWSTTGTRSGSGNNYQNWTDGAGGTSVGIVVPLASGDTTTCEIDKILMMSGSSRIGSNP